VKITIEAAAERLRLSARPGIGTVTGVIADGEIPKWAASTPLASLPKTEIYESSRGSSRIEVVA
jgi:hypothetical protein